MKNTKFMITLKNDLIIQKNKLSSWVDIAATWVAQI